MNIDFPFRKQGLNITGVFQYMRENGYNPSFEYTHIQFECDGNTAVVECEDGFVTVRIFFSIEADEYDLFIEASNLMMTQTYSVKSVVLEDRENIVFSCEFFCDNLKDFKSFFPRPYLKVETPKKNKEKRKLGLLTIKDKIVQQAIRSLIEPQMEKVFFGNSYGYRLNKGAVKAVRRALQERKNKNTPWILKLDIDNYFDNVDHEILLKRIQAIIPDSEIIRLIMLCVKMGVVNKKGKWKDSTKGIPQGAVISPLLANLYLHSFDQFILSRNLPYVRYAI